jgi:xanthine dehydrogenase YagR molybdenum-binding subunit
MTTYIGTATSRVDGHAKVTGAAKYAAEFKAPDLAHAVVVASTIAKGRITRIDTTKALSVAGVIDVLTHQNRPQMASADSAYKDDVAPEGMPYRPLYDDRIRFSGQPVALVVAEEPEIARFAASLVAVEYDEEPHVTELHRQRDAAFSLESPRNPAENPFAPPPPRGQAEQAFAAATKITIGRKSVGRACSTSPTMRSTRTGWRVLILQRHAICVLPVLRPASMHSNAQWTSLPLR